MGQTGPMAADGGEVPAVLMPELRWLLKVEVLDRAARVEHPELVVQVREDRARVDQVLVDRVLVDRAADEAERDSIRPRCLLAVIWMVTAN